MVDRTILFVRRANCTQRVLPGKPKGLLGVSLSPFASGAMEKAGTMLFSSIMFSVICIATSKDSAPRLSWKGSYGMRPKMGVRRAAFAWRTVVQTRAFLTEANATTTPMRRQLKTVVKNSLQVRDLRPLPPTQGRLLLRGSAKRVRRATAVDARKRFSLARRLWAIIRMIVPSEMIKGCVVLGRLPAVKSAPMN